MWERRGRGWGRRGVELLVEGGVTRVGMFFWGLIIFFFFWKVIVMDKVGMFLGRFFESFCDEVWGGSGGLCWFL